MAHSAGLHEDYQRSGRIRSGSDRGFGLLFSAVFAIVAGWPLIGGDAPRWWALAVAVGLLPVALLRPALLAPFNRLWFRFGLLLHRIVSPVVLGLLFFLTVTPVALIMRVLGKDPLRLRMEPDASTYWIERTPPGPDPATMPKQF